MIGYMKSTRDNVWMTSALSVRNMSRTTADNVHIICICSDNIWMTCTYAHVNNVQIRHAEKTINTDYLTNHLYDPEMKQLNILVTNSIQ